MAIVVAITPPRGQSVDATRKQLLDRVRPSGWNNPAPRPVYDLVILGAGPAGLAAADEAIAAGLSLALVERDFLGGTSLNTGSVPSKAIIATAHVFAAMREAHEFGAVFPAEPTVDFPAVMARMRRICSRIAEYHSVDRLCSAGVDVFFGEARFVEANGVLAGSTRLNFRKALIATGARSSPCAIPGLANVGYQTSETIFDSVTLPARLAIIGGGPLGCEMAQAFCRLGSHVILLQNDPKFLPREERDAAELLSLALSRDGVETRLNTTVTGARGEAGAKVLETVNNEVQADFTVDEVLLSIGRVPTLVGLCAEAASVQADFASGIKIDDFLATSNPDVYAAGDVCMEHKFTNVAEITGRMAVRNAFAFAGKRINHLTIPWCTFSDPEIAHIGLYVWEARERGIPVTTVTVMMQDTDRAIVDGEDDGFVKIHIKDGTDQILGATIVASRASEMINEMSVIMWAGMGMRDLANVSLHIYPARNPMRSARPQPRLTFEPVAHKRVILGPAVSPEPGSCRRLVWSNNPPEHPVVSDTGFKDPTASALPNDDRLPVMSWRPDLIGQPALVTGANFRHWPRRRVGSGPRGLRCRRELRHPAGHRHGSGVRNRSDLFTRYRLARGCQQRERSGTDVRLTRSRISGRCILSSATRVLQRDAAIDQMTLEQWNTVASA